MKNTFKVSLKANERIYINGAVLRVDRKTSIEFLNDVNFLLENHVLQAEDATTPLRQLYFVVQVILMAPQDAASTLELYRAQIASLLDAYANPLVLSALKAIDQMVHEKKYYEAMKSIRTLFPIDDDIVAMPGGAGSSAGKAAPGTAPLKKTATG